MSYENCTLQVKSNLFEIARMAYGSGSSEGRTGGAGRMGLLNANGGGLRIVKFNTHLSERLFGASADDDMRQAANNLRTELVRIAQSAGIEGPELENIRRRLGMTGANMPTSLLNRKDVAAVVTMIGGQEVWDEALDGVNMADYSSRGRDTHFVELKARSFRREASPDRNLAPLLKKDEVVSNSRMPLTSNAVRRYLAHWLADRGGAILPEGASDEDRAEAAGPAVNGLVAAVFDEEAVRACIESMRRGNGVKSEDELMRRFDAIFKFVVESCTSITGGIAMPADNKLGRLRTCCARLAGAGSQALQDRLSAGKCLKKFLDTVIPTQTDAIFEKLMSFMEGKDIRAVLGHGWMGGLEVRLPNFMGEEGESIRRDYRPNEFKYVLSAVEDSYLIYYNLADTGNRPLHEKFTSLLDEAVKTRLDEVNLGKKVRLSMTFTVFCEKLIGKKGAVLAKLMDCDTDDPVVANVVRTLDNLQKQGDLSSCEEMRAQVRKAFIDGLKECKIGERSLWMSPENNVLMVFWSMIDMALLILDSVTPKEMEDFDDFKDLHVMEDMSLGNIQLPEVNDPESEIQQGELAKGFLED